MKTKTIILIVYCLTIIFLFGYEILTDPGQFDIVGGLTFNR